MLEKPNNPPKQLMGIGKLGNPNLIFARQFRWTLKGKYLQDHWNKSVNIQYTDKTINLSAYEVFMEDGTIPIHVWAEGMEKGEFKDESLILTTFDGCGYPLYAYKFIGIKLKSRHSDFDYRSSDVSYHKITLTFDKYRKHQSTESYFPLKKEEKAEVNFLNAKTWVK